LKIRLVVGGASTLLGFLSGGVLAGYLRRRALVVKIVYFSGAAENGDFPWDNGIDTCEILLQMSDFLIRFGGG